jgi:hypothetical protein
VDVFPRSRLPLAVLRPHCKNHCAPCIILPVFWGLIYRGIPLPRTIPESQSPQIFSHAQGSHFCSITVLSLGHSTEKSHTRLFIGPLSFVVRILLAALVASRTLWTELGAPNSFTFGWCGRRFLLTALRHDADQARPSSSRSRQNADSSLVP